MRVDYHRRVRWFWAAAGGVIATATVTTYFLTRPTHANEGGLTSGA